MNTKRRDFLLSSAAATGALFLPSRLIAQEAAKKASPLFKLSIAEWSYHKALFSKKMTNLDFPAKCKEMGGFWRRVCEPIFQNQGEGHGLPRPAETALR